MPFSDMSASDWHRSLAFGAFLVFGDFVLDNCVAPSLDKLLSTVWAVGVFIFVAMNVSEVGIENSCFFRHVICFF